MQKDEKNLLAKRKLSHLGDYSSHLGRTKDCRVLLPEHQQVQRANKQATNQRAVFQVDDTGDGIPEDAITQLFEPFYRVQNDASTQTGNGFGLAISNEIAHRLEGRIILKNKPEGGLVFIYTQPC